MRPSPLPSALLLLLAFLAIAPSPVAPLDATAPQAACLTDDDCSARNRLLPNWAPGPQPAGFICVAGACQYVVAPGRICRSSQDCSLFQFASRAIARNASSLLPLAAANAPSISAFLDGICAPEYCTIASYCDPASDPLFPNQSPVNVPKRSASFSCCRGADPGDSCARIGSFLDSCADGAACTATSPSIPDQLVCGPIKTQSYQWIGILLSLIGAATINIGLNLQKFALRKRHEKVVRKKEVQRSLTIQKISSIRIGISDLYRKYSINNLSFGTRRSSSNTSSLPRSQISQFFQQQSSASSTSSPSQTSVNPSINTGTAPFARGTLRSSPAHAPSLSNKLSNLSISATAAAHSDAGGTDTARASTDAGAGAGGRTKDQVFHVHEMLSIAPVSPVTPKDAPTTLAQSASRSDSPKDATASTLVATDDNDAIVVAPRPRPRPRRKSITDSAHRRSAGNLSEVLDKPEFQTKLNFGSLIRNPAWVLGMLVFIMGNFLNFIALQFAAQSLLGPLGSISLVVNVIIAPLINNEKWTWKDILGVVFIVGGSSMVVVFAGVSDKDYNLCVLLALFERDQTIAFLTTTAALTAIVFSCVVVIERNLDIVQEPSAATISETLRGRLVRVETRASLLLPDSAHDGTTIAKDGHANKKYDESNTHHRKSVILIDDDENNGVANVHNDDVDNLDLDQDEHMIADPAKGIAVCVRNLPSTHGQRCRTLTITEMPTLAEHSNKACHTHVEGATSTHTGGLTSGLPTLATASTSDDTAMTVAAAPASSTIDARTGTNNIIPNLETIGDLLNSRDADGHSIKSVSLTFVIDNDGNKDVRVSAPPAKARHSIFSTMVPPLSTHGAHNVTDSEELGLSDRRVSLRSLEIVRGNHHDPEARRVSNHATTAFGHSGVDESKKESVGPIVIGAGATSTSDAAPVGHAPPTSAGLYHDIDARAIQVDAEDHHDGNNNDNDADDDNDDDVYTARNSGGTAVATSTIEPPAMVTHRRRRDIEKAGLVHKSARTSSGGHAGLTRGTNLVETGGVMNLSQSSGSNAGTLTRKPTMYQRMMAPIRSHPVFRAIRNIKLVPRLKTKIPLDSVYVRVILPFSYASIGGLMATITVLFAKATIHLISTSIINNSNQYTNFGSWVITGVTVFTAVGQLYWINMGLQRYDALLQIPVYYVIWTLFDVIGGGIYFDEFQGFTPTKFGLFCLGLGIIFGGVVVLATRLKSLSDEEQALATVAAATTTATAAADERPSTSGSSSDHGSNLGDDRLAISSTIVPVSPVDTDHTDHHHHHRSSISHDRGHVGPVTSVSHAHAPHMDASTATDHGEITSPDI